MLKAEGSRLKGRAEGEGAGIRIKNTGNRKTVQGGKIRDRRSEIGDQYLKPDTQYLKPRSRRAEIRE